MSETFHWHGSSLAWTGKQFIFRGNAYSICVHQNGLKCFCSWAPQMPPTFPPQEKWEILSPISVASWLPHQYMDLGGQRLDRQCDQAFILTSSLSPPLQHCHHWSGCLPGPTVSGTPMRLQGSSRSLSNIPVTAATLIDTNDNDIAFPRLSSSVSFTDYICPVCLCAANSTFVFNTKSWVTD